MIRFAVVLLFLLPAWSASASASAAGEGQFHRDLTVRLSPGSHLLSVTDRIHIRGSGSVGFRLMPELRLTAITIDGRRLQPPPGGDNVVFKRRFDLGPAATHDVVLEYEGSLAPRPGGAFREAFVGGEGSYLPPAVDWIAGFNAKQFTYRLTVETPASQRAVVPGRLVAEERTEGGYRAVFESEMPASGIVLLAGPYRIDERRHGKVRLRTYFGPKTAPLADAYLNSAAGFIDFFSEWIGAYPFSAFHMVSGPLPVGLGYTNLTYMGSKVLRLPFIRRTSLGHEVLHNWWGNGVFTNIAGGNWAEGLTTFMADYTLIENRSILEARERRLGWLRDYAALPAARDRRAAEFSTKRHDAGQVVGYNKVAFFFYMLRRTLGRQVFDRGIRLFWQRHKFATAGWPQLRRSFETVSGRDLKGFFDQWLRRKGAPRLALGSVSTMEKDAGYGVRLTLVQQPPFYDLEVPVMVTTDAGTEVFSVRSSRAETRVHLRVPGRPRSLAVDPDYQIFRRLHPSAAPPILRDVTLADGASVIIVAGDGEGEAAAGNLARRLLDLPPRFTPPGLPLPEAPVLVIGTTASVRAYLSAAGLPEVPGLLAGRGTARVWAFRHKGRAGLVVAARDAGALEALIGPLPHYGRQGYLVFDGPKAIDRGSWPAESGPLRVKFD